MPRKPFHPETAALLGACQSCEQYPVRVAVSFPAMPDYGIDAAEFWLCADCAEFAAPLIERAESDGVSL